MEPIGVNEQELSLFSSYLCHKKQVRIREHRSSQQ